MLNKFAALMLAIGIVGIAGCNERETGIVVDQDEVAKYETPPGAIEAAIAEQMENSKANKNKGKKVAK